MVCESNSMAMPPTLPLPTSDASGRTLTSMSGMTLRPTYAAPGSARYRRPGGPWDGPPLDAALASSGRRPDRLVDGSVRLSGDDLEERIAEVAGGLHALGVRRRSVVA